MTNAQQIIAKLAERQTARQAYEAAPSMQGWRELNALNNSLIPFAKSTPITRAEYESLLPGLRLNDDDTIYRYQSSWWIGDDEIVWCLAHYARQAALIAERGAYVAPTDAMLGLELVTDGMPEGFREWQEGQR